MTWFKVDDGFYDHPKFVDVPNAAIGLWAKAGAWCGRHLTDGLIPASQVKLFRGTPAQVRALISAGIWSEGKAENGAKAYLFHDWGDYQPSREEKLSEREKAAVRKRKSRENTRSLSSFEERIECDLSSFGAQNEREMNSFGAQNARKMRGNVTSENAPTRDYEKMSRCDTPAPVTPLSQRPDPTRPDPTRPIDGVTTSLPAYGSNAGETAKAGSEIPPMLADAARRARHAGATQAAIDEGLRRYEQRPHPKGPGLLRVLIDDAQAEINQQQTRAHQHAQVQARREEIAACDLCDENGWRDTPSGVVRCNHKPF